MKIRTFEAEMWLPLPIREVFAFFTDVANLDRITPPWLHFHIVTPTPLVLQTGTRIDYQLRVKGIPIRWRTEILDWEPPYRFVDQQLKGPYRQWLHTHTFAEKDGGTMMHDRVEYAVPGWFLEPLLDRFFVGPDIRKIFAYRQEKIQELLISGARSASKG